MSMIAPLRRRSRCARILRRFGRDEDGSIIVFTIILLIIMLVIGGMAVDFMRFESRRAVLQSVTDRSVLASSKLTQELDPEEVIYDFFEISGFDRSIVTPNVLEDSASARTVNARAALDVGTHYLRFIGIDELTAPSFAEANEGVNKVEVSLVLDYSASMRVGGTTGRITEFGTTRGRIGDLQDAAAAFADELLKPEYDGRFSLNIIPYGGHVNPGEAMFDYMGGVRNEPVDIYDPNFDLAVNAAFNVEDTIFWAEHANEGFPGAYIFAGPDGDFDTVVDNVDLTPLLNGRMLGERDASGNYLNLPTTVIPELIGLDVFGPDGEYGTDDDDQTAFADPGETAVVAYRYEQQSHCFEIAESNWTNSDLPSTGQNQLPVFMRYGFNDWEIEQQVRGWGWCPGDAMRIQYGMQDADKVDTFFEKITTHDGTGTDIAMKWGLALLDPDARSAFTHLNTQFDSVTGDRLVPDASLGRPADWDDEETDKILILMTDGFITAQFRPSDLHSREALLTQKITNGNQVVDDNVTRTTERLLAQCELAKDPDLRDVEVYTIAFETSAAAGAIMEECASDGRYSATAGSGLTDVFADIARQITQLRLTQ